VRWRILSQLYPDEHENVVRDGPRTQCCVDLAIADSWVESDRGGLRRKLRRSGHEQAETVLLPQSWLRYHPQWRPFAANSPATSLACCRTSTDQAHVRHRAGPCSGIRNARSSSHDIAVQRSSQTCSAPYRDDI
jgi:hypothetical protein